ncbi:MAG: YDG domain-containing protein [Methylotenera sp.]
MNKIMKPQQQLNLTQQARMRVLLSALICGAFNPAQALPTGEQVQAGNIGFVRDAQSLSINQTSQQAIVNWQSFGVAANEAVRLYQPNQGVALFRVVGSDPSQIFGSLSATGSLFLTNPNGVLFAPGAQVNVGSLLATTMQISDQDFLARHYQFNGDSNAAVINGGVIHAEDGGYIALLGNAVENSGTMQANNGSVVLGSAQSALLDIYGDGLVQVKLSGDGLNAVINQSGNIMANGGTVQLAAHARMAALNVDGVVQANSLVERNGVIRLEGGAGSKVKVTGKLEARGENAGSKGGVVTVTGEQVALLDRAAIDVSGQTSGGTALIGGDYQGKNTAVQNARTTYIGSGAKINADATNSGDGGKVVVWSDDTTRYYGSISAQGGALSGNGGFVEVSGKRNLDFIGGIDVGAVNGMGGHVLLDPQDILLNTSTQPSPPNNANGTPDIAFANPPAAGTTTIQIADVTGYSELFLQATRDITVASAITMAVNNSIRLEANNNISVNAAVAVSGTGSINLKADADNSGAGNLAIGANITSQVGGITISGATVTRTAGNIAASGAANSNAGNINISATNTVNLGAATVTANGGTASAGNAGRNSGAISISGNGVAMTGTITASGSNGNGANTVGGNAGSVNVTSTNGISIGAATASGGASGAGGAAAGGNAGTIAITNSTAGNLATSALNARTGNATGIGAGGVAGSVTVFNNAGGTLATGAITTAGGNNGNGGNINLNSAAGSITSGALVSSGGTVLTGNAGKNAGAIAITAGGNITAGAITATGSAGLGTNQNGGNGAAVLLNAGGATPSITMTNISTNGGAATGTGIIGAGGNITVADNAVLSANTTINATGGSAGTAGTVAFNGTINSTGAARTLTINNNGALMLNGAIGNTFALGALTTNTGGTTAINGGSVATTGAQAYNDAVTLGANATLTASNSAVTFASSVNAAGNQLAVAAGTGAVTATNAANDFSNLAITAGSASIRDANTIELGATNVTGNYSLRTAGAITQNAGITVGGTATLNAGAGNNITLNNASNNFNAVAVTSGRDVSLVDANAMTINASSVRTISARTLSNDLTLGGNIVATGAGSGTSITLAAAQNFLNPGNRTLTPGAGSRWLVFSTNPANDTRGANLITAHDFKQYNATLGDTILGTGDGFIYTLAPVITSTLSGAVAKTYDTTTNAAISGLSVSSIGSVDGDTVVLSALTSASFDDKNAGAGKTVSSNLLSIASASNGAKPLFGYQLASTTASANIGTITPASITAVTGIAANNKTYDASTAATINTGAAGFTGIIGADVLNVATASGNFSDKNVGTGKTVNISGIALGGADAGNYTLTMPTATAVANITPASLTVNGQTASNKVYDATASATLAGGTLSGVLGSDVVSLMAGTGSFSDKNVGNAKAVTVAGTGLSGADAGNYTVADPTGLAANITPADITAVNGITANNKIYDATSAATLNTGGATFAGSFGGDVLTVATATGNFADSNAGAGKTVNINGISLGGADAGNYNLTSSSASTTADITARAITITADPGQNKVVGNADPLPFTFTIGGLGLVAGDMLTGALSRIAGEAAGSYAINQGSLDAGSNYALSYIGNNFTILAAPVTGGSSNPRNAAGLVDLNPMLDNYTNQQLFVLNVGFTAAGNDSAGNQQACEEDPETLAKDKDFILMLNYGLKLPKDVNASCDKASI